MIKSVPIQSPILKRVYLLIILLILSAVVDTVILARHVQTQQILYGRLSHFHTPTIYYANKLSATLQEIGYTIKQHYEADKVETGTDILKNPAYSIKRYASTINQLAHQHPDISTERAQQRLQQEISLLTESLQNQSIKNNSKPHQLEILIQSTLSRAQQLSRLHTNSSEKLRHQLADREQRNVTFLTQLMVITFLIGGVLIVPLVVNIRRMVRSLHHSEQYERELKEQAEHERSRMRALLSAMNIGVLFEDKQGCIEFVNPAFNRIWGVDANHPLIGQNINKLLEQSPHHFSCPEHASKFVLQVLDTHEISERFEIDFNDGRTFTQLSFPVLDLGEGMLGRLWIYEDITHERQTAQQLLYLAEHDPLTGLSNRHCFQKQLAFMINAAKRNNSKFALLYFDLDEFKFINDTFGHGAGDSVLLRTASEISDLVRGIEMFARLGGDEFSLLATLGPDDDISALPIRIVNAIASIPFRFRGTNLRLTASVGVAIYPEHGNNVEELVAHADTAMYQAKNLGKNTWSIYNPKRNDSALMVERMSWSRRISQALEQDLLELHFQGIYQTADSKLSHLEVLVRMRDPANSNRLIMPGSFIPFAEKTTQIVDIDRWVLNRSIALLAEYPELPSLAVNISGRSLDEPSLPQYIQEKMSHYGINPARLLIELTETETVSDLQDAQRFIEAIRRAGCKVCLDDFGSGFSTFTYLKYLDVEILKIDGMFIQDLVNNYANQVFVKAMVSIAQGFGKLLVAECVENAETLKLLQDLDVQLVQGYYLDYPVGQHEALERYGIEIENDKLTKVTRK